MKLFKTLPASPPGDGRRALAEELGLLVAAGALVAAVLALLGAHATREEAAVAAAAFGGFGFAYFAWLVWYVCRAASHLIGSRRK